MYLRQIKRITRQRCLILLIISDFIDKAANYMIPKHELINRCFISITLGDLKIIGFPTCIENKAYSRNAYLTNLCFVFDHDTRTVCYESIIRKCTEYLVSIFYLIYEINMWLIRGMQSSRLLVCTYQKAVFFVRDKMS